MRLRTPSLVSAVAAVLVASALTACSWSASAPDDRPLVAPSSTFQGEVPEFTGPWAAEFTEAYRSTTSETIHKILAKGSISDQDYASVSSQFVRCMKNKGFTVKITWLFGESTVTGDGDVNTASNACNDDMS